MGLSLQRSEAVISLAYEKIADHQNEGNPTQAWPKAAGLAR